MDKVRLAYLQGDGVAEDIWSASREALEEAVIKAYEGSKRIEWTFLRAGIEALEKVEKCFPGRPSMPSGSGG